MSNLPGNPHMHDAMNYSCAASEIMAHEDHERGILAQQATTHATLALAYEQRTANLLKVLELQVRMHDAQQAFNLSALDVAERLGLGATK